MRQGFLDGMDGRMLDPLRRQAETIEEDRNRGVVRCVQNHDVTLLL